MRQDRTKRQALGVEQKSISRRELSAAKSEGKMRARSLCGCWAAFFFFFFGRNEGSLCFRQLIGGGRSQRVGRHVTQPDHLSGEVRLI